jgi:hypothetical protein
MPDNVSRVNAFYCLPHLHFPDTDKPVSQLAKQQQQTMTGVTKDLEGTLFVSIVTSLFPLQDEGSECGLEE